MAMGMEARAQVQRWDWRASTMHLLTVLYPMAIARFKEQAAEKQAIPSPSPAAV